MSELQPEHALAADRRGRRVARTPRPAIARGDREDEPDAAVRLRIVKAADVPVGYAAGEELAAET